LPPVSRLIEIAADSRSTSRLSIRVVSDSMASLMLVPMLT
jgi:hypothetical protein